MLHSVDVVGGERNMLLGNSEGMAAGVAQRSRTAIVRTPCAALPFAALLLLPGNMLRSACGSIMYLRARELTRLDRCGLVDDLSVYSLGRHAAVLHVRYRFLYGKIPQSTISVRSSFRLCRALGIDLAGLWRTDHSPPTGGSGWP